LRAIVVVLAQQLTLAEQPRVGLVGRPNAGRRTQQRNEDTVRLRADRASGPITEMSVGVSTPPSAWPRIGSRFQVGLWPYTPQ
jgi:hypothetical protein